MGRPKRKINTIDLKTMSNQQIADLATEDLRRILWDLKKKATLRDQDFEDCFEDLYTLFLSGEIRQDLDEEKLKNGATIGNYMYKVAKSYAVDWRKGQPHTMQDSEEGFLDTITKSYRTESQSEKKAGYSKKLILILSAWFRKTGYTRMADYVDYTWNGVPEEEIQKKIGVVDRGYTWFKKEVESRISKFFRIGRYTIQELLADSELVPTEWLDLRMTFCRDSELMTHELEKKISREVGLGKNAYRLITEGIADGLIKARKEGGWIFIEKISGDRFVVKLQKLKEIKQAELVLDDINATLKKLKETKGE